MQSRRGFLAAAAGLLAGAALDPDRLLWRPGAKIFSIPSPIIGAPFITVQWTREQLAYVERCLVFHRNAFLLEWKPIPELERKGITIHVPARFDIAAGRGRLG